MEGLVARAVATIWCRRGVGRWRREWRGEWPVGVCRGGAGFGRRVERALQAGELSLEAPDLRGRDGRVSSESVASQWPRYHRGRYSAGLASCC